MTIIAGFQCLDGLLMCADSEQTFFEDSDAKSQVQKLAEFHAAHAYVVIGGAGDSEMIEYTHYQLGQRLNSDCPKPQDVEVWLQSFANDIWTKCIEPYRGFAADLVPEASFLVGVQVSDACSLYRWERNTIRKVKAHASVGVGNIQAEPLLGDLRLRFTANHMLLYAVRTMSRVKQLVQGCGGNTEIVWLKNKGLPYRFATVHIDAIEYLIEEVDRFLLKDVLRFISGHAKLSESVDLDVQIGELRQFQDRYQKILREMPYFS